MNSSRLPLSLLIAAGLVSLGFTTGCSTTVVTVDSLTHTQPHVTSYVLQSRTPSLADDPALYQEAVNYLHTALARKGMHEAPEGTTPALVVSFDFGIGPPILSRQKIKDPTYVTEIGPIESDTLARPIRRKVGEREVVFTTTVYEKYLSIVAREAVAEVAGRATREMWTIDVVIAGTSQDLHKALPVLVAASIDYIGENSQGREKVRLKDDAPNVILVKESLKELSTLP